MAEPPDLHTLWIGPRLSWLERLCLTSWLTHGHRVVLWAYAPIAGVPPGVEIRQAAEILPEKAVIVDRATGSPALFSNHFRYNLFAHHDAIWLDTDVLLLRPLVEGSDYLFGWESPQVLGTAVLRLPSRSRLLRDLLALTAARVPVPSWWPFRRKFRQRFRGLYGRHQSSADMHWPTFGPTALTEMARAHGLLEHALPIEVFYPIHWSEETLPFERPEIVENRLTAKTVAVHLWSARLTDRQNAPPPAGSWLAVVGNRIGVSLSA